MLQYVAYIFAIEKLQEILFKVQANVLGEGYIKLQALHKQRSSCISATLE